MRGVVVLVALVALVLGARSELHHPAHHHPSKVSACLTIIRQCVNHEQYGTCPPC